MSADKTKPPKKWHKVKVLDSYEQADTLRNSLIADDNDSGLLVKIRRCGPRGTKFKVKTWRPTEVTKNKKKD